MTREEQQAIRDEIGLIQRLVKMLQVKNSIEQACKEKIDLRLEVLKARIA